MSDCINTLYNTFTCLCYSQCANKTAFLDDIYIYKIISFYLYLFVEENKRSFYFHPRCHRKTNWQVEQQQLQCCFSLHLTGNCSPVMDAEADCPSPLVYCSLSLLRLKRKSKVLPALIPTRVQDSVTSTNQTCRLPSFALRPRLSVSSADLDECFCCRENYRSTLSSVGVW